MPTHNNKLKLIGLLAVFILPVAISWLLYAEHNVFALKTLNRGTLVQPALATALNQTHQWQIMFVPAQCNANAADHEMFMLHQLRKVLGKDGERVSLLLAGKTECEFGETHDFQRWSFSISQYDNLKHKLKLAQLEDKIYLLDPQGNIFMYYSANTDTMNILTDLKRVLEVSQIG
jgi:hypothetical protein